MIDRFARRRAGPDAHKKAANRFRIAQKRQLDVETKSDPPLDSWRQMETFTLGDPTLPDGQ